MEQRAEPRIAVATEVTVDVLGDNAHTVDAEMVNLSSRGMRLSTYEPIEVDSALRIRVDGDQYIGEVTHCTKEGGCYYVGVSLVNVIRNIAQVSEQMARLLASR